MGEMPLSLRLEEKTIAALEREAVRRGVLADEVAEEAISSYLESWEREREVIGQRIAEADRGIFISEEAMTRWVDSWGTEHELQPPKPDIFPEKPE